ncbi:hypothetical protein [Endozoicomonas sp. 4G]|uniref:hypothetical protein n=1 Tax=Endozoicomonas sp. 4G TaxID=2872754 RepID=UPI002078B5FD|nr:hypothetical protein [Endozoicomonas sp. 4G]
MIVLIRIRLYFIFTIFLSVLALGGTTKVNAGGFFQVLDQGKVRGVILSYLSARDLFSLMEALNIGAYQRISMLIKHDLYNRVNAFNLDYITPLLWRECEDQEHKWHDYRAFTHWFHEFEDEFDYPEINDHIRGVPMPGMIEYKPLVSIAIENIKFVISYTWIMAGNENEWHVFGEMVDDSVFYFKSECCYTGFTAWGTGLIWLAPSWDYLLQNMSESETEIFISSLNLDDLSKDVLIHSKAVESSECKELFSYFLQTLMLKDEYESYKAQIRFEHQKLDSKKLPSYIN